MHTTERRVPQNEVCTLVPLTSQQEKTADGQRGMLEHAPHAERCQGDWKHRVGGQGTV